VAGAIGATTNNEIGIASTAQLASVIGCRYLDASGDGQLSDGISCLNYCLQQGAQIYSNSWGTTQYLQAMDNAVTAITSAGGLVVCSAGNDGIDVDTAPHYPSSFSEEDAAVVSVGACDQQGNLWSGSNYGTKGVTIAAPGVNLLGLGLGGLYTKLTGTSMSSKYYNNAVPVQRYVWGA
jgi:hypothetical protein